MPCLPISFLARSAAVARKSACCTSQKRILILYFKNVPPKNPPRPQYGGATALEPSRASVIAEEEDEIPLPRIPVGAAVPLAREDSRPISIVRKSAFPAIAAPAAEVFAPAPAAAVPGSARTAVVGAAAEAEEWRVTRHVEAGTTANHEANVLVGEDMVAVDGRMKLNKGLKHVETGRASMQRTAVATAVDADFQAKIDAAEAAKKARAELEAGAALLKDSI